MQSEPDKLFDRWRARGDAEALAQVFDQLAPGLLRLAVHLVDDAAAAEDLVQETFVAAMREAATWDRSRALEPWLQGILANRAREMRRSARRRTDAHALLARAEIEERTPLDEALGAELSGELARALDRLPEAQRTVLVLRLRHGMSAADIAHALGSSPGAVRVQIHRGRETLKRVLPVGLVGALAMLVEPARGLGAVKVAVLAQSAAHVGAGLAVGGVLVGKKIAFALALVVVLLSIAWFVGRDGGSARARDFSSSAVEPDHAQLATTANAAVVAPASESSERAHVAATAPIARGTTLRCRVLDGESGAPLAGAAVHVFAPVRTTLAEVVQRWPERLYADEQSPRLADDWPWTPRMLTREQISGGETILSYEDRPAGTETIADGVSDADGVVSFDLPPTLGFIVCDAPGFETRKLAPSIDRTRYCSQSNGKTKTVRHHYDPLPIRMFHAHTLRGQLIDMDGQPLRMRLPLHIAGQCSTADVVAVSYDPDHVHYDSEPVDSWMVWTADDGSFEARVAAPVNQIVRTTSAGWIISNVGMHPVHKQSWVFGLEEPLVLGDTLVWVPVRPAPVLVVKDATDGSPIEDFFLLRYKTASTSSARTIHATGGRVNLKSSEEFSRWNIGGTTTAIVVWARDHRQKRIEFAGAMSDTEIVCPLERGNARALDGLVQDHARPVAGALVMISPLDDGVRSEEHSYPFTSTRTGADGRFHFSVPDGGWWIRVTHDGRSLLRQVQVPGDDSLMIDLGAEIALDVDVTNPDGTPCEHAQVTLTAQDQAVHLAMADMEGHAHIGSLRSGRQTLDVVSVDSGQRLDRHTDIELAEGEVKHLTIALTASSAVSRGRLVVAGETVLDGWRARDQVGSGPAWFPIAADGALPKEVDPRNRFIEVENSKRARWWFQLERAAQEGIELHISPLGASYRGVIRAADGSPRAGIQILVALQHEGNDPIHVSMQTDADGRFELPGLPAKQLGLQIDNPNRGSPGFIDSANFWFSPRASASSAGTDLEIEFSPSMIADSAKLVVRGTARTPNGPCTECYVGISAEFEQKDGRLGISTGASTTSLGQYEVSTFRAPAYRAYVRAHAGGRPFESPFNLDGTGTSFVRDFDLP